jgi:sugar lactone lactonase YvrE
VSGTLDRLWLAGALAVGALLLTAPASGAATLRAGDILVADDAWTDNNGAIVSIDPRTGAQQVVSSGDLFSDPYDLVLTPRGQLYVVDRDAATDADGAVIRVDPATGAQTLVSSEGGFGNPTAVAREASGRLLVLDEDFTGNAVIRVDPATGAQSQLGPEGLLDDPSGITVDEQQRIFVSDEDATDSFQGAVLQIDPVTGGQTVVADNPNPADPELFRDPFDVFSDRRGGLYVVDESSQTMGEDDGGLLSVTLAGEVERVSMSGAFVNPHAGAVTQSGNILVSDNSAFDPDFVGAVIRVNPVTGEQSTVAREGELANPDGLIVVPHRCKGRFATIQGTNGADTITGTPFADVIVTYRGRDRISAGGGNDIVCAGANADVLGGAKGRDSLFGQAGHDKLFGGSGKDRLRGGPGRDLLRR